ncbi:uncharacterized protein N7479_004325 [Penicillium vulpinum]|uniref:uncharacterized protein n=1 Tax=Penicillium vulpinum TaxID=29845 RepID=UPI00254779BA|nr:uncharacterized protein N7479_004325 [Penicillium vulpinum]KAJ5964449.1 hypothetical protein N7479_004325 [Penicillium vulpinum]
MGSRRNGSMTTRTVPSGLQTPVYLLLSQARKDLWARSSHAKPALKVCDAGCCLYPVLTLEGRPSKSLAFAWPMSGVVFYPVRNSGYPGILGCSGIYCYYHEKNAG